jgi:hypothetical protein
MVNISILAAVGLIWSPLFAQADETSARNRMLKLCEALGVKVARDDLTCKFHPALKDWAPESAQWLVTDGRVSMHMSVGGRSFLLVDGNAQAKIATQPFNGATAILKTQADVELCARQLSFGGFRKRGIWWYGR